MPITPTGPLNDALYRLRGLLASSEAFQSFVGVAEADLGTPESEVLALSRIVEIGTREQTMPRAVIDLNNGANWSRVSIDGGAACRDATSLLLMLEAEIDTQYLATYGDAHFTFTNAVGAVMDDVWTIAHGSGEHNILIGQIQQISGPSRSSEPEAARSGDYYQSIFAITVGLSGGLR